MKLAVSNTDGDAKKAIAIGMQMLNSIVERGKRDIVVASPDSGDKYFVRAIKNGSRRELIVYNLNPFKVTAAANDTVDGREYPSFQWQGGTPPFQIRVVYKDVAGVYQMDMYGKLVNLDPNLIDGTGDSTPNRNYYLYRTIDAEGWWGDDGTGTPQDAIGVLIEDAAGRQLFAPFTPAAEDPLAQLYGHYGPPDWCEPPIDWTLQATAVYGAVLDGAFLSAMGRVPGTTGTELEGHYTYQVTVGGVPVAIAEQDALGPLLLTPAEGYKPSATSAEGVSPHVLPVTVEFQATDSAHYHLATLAKTITVSKADQDAYATFDLRILRNTLHPEIGAYSFVPGDTGWFVFVHQGTSTPWNTPPPSGGSFRLTSSNLSVLSLGNGGVVSLMTQTGHSAGSASELDGACTGYMVPFTANAAGRFQETAFINGTNDYNQSGNLYFFDLYGVVFGMNSVGGVSFDINDPAAITYGEALDFTTTSPISGDSFNYPATAHSDAGWEIDPAWGTMLETNPDGSALAHSITAVFHPADAVTYPAEMAYEQWLTVTKDTPVIVWPPNSFYIYGYSWDVLFRQSMGQPPTAYNSHHVGDSGWEVPGDFTITVTNKAENNGVITDWSVIPSTGYVAGTGSDPFNIQVTGFTPTGPEAHNYTTAAVSDVKSIRIDRYPSSISFDVSASTITAGGTVTCTNIQANTAPCEPYLSLIDKYTVGTGTEWLGNDTWRFNNPGTYPITYSTYDDANQAGATHSHTITVNAATIITGIWRTNLIGYTYGGQQYYYRETAQFFSDAASGTMYYETYDSYLASPTQSVNRPYTWSGSTVTLPAYGTWPARTLTIAANHLTMFDGTDTYYKQ